MWHLLIVLLAGFIAQLIDGAMGMAFGVTCTSMLVALSYSPAAASAIIHLAELGTASVSGLSHIRFNNVDWHALVKVAVPGALGAFLGAVCLSTLDLQAARPWTSGLLLVLGLVILFRFTRPAILGVSRRAHTTWLVPLGLVGGLVDSTGGGGWGPIVTTTLTASSALEPRKAIGTTNTAEFFIAAFASIGFLYGLGAEEIPWGAVGALLVGGVLAAPLAAWMVRTAPQRILGIIVGNLVVLLNVRQLGISCEIDSQLLYGAYALALLLLGASLRSGLRLLPLDRQHISGLR
jgi:uncharacterized membrane protein YfcA